MPPWTIRRETFDPILFLGKGWKVKEENEETLALSRVSFSDIRLVTMFGEDRKVLTWKHRRKRVQEAGYIPLGAGHFLAMWNERYRIPMRWRFVRPPNHWSKEKRRNIGKVVATITFDGTVLIDHLGREFVLHLSWNARGSYSWSWYIMWTEMETYFYTPSAVISPPGSLDE